MGASPSRMAGPRLCVRVCPGGGCIVHADFAAGSNHGEKIMTPKPFLTRKDIARTLGICVRTVKRNEKRWGLVRVDFKSRVVKYRRESLPDCVASLLPRLNNQARLQQRGHLALPQK